MANDLRRIASALAGPPAGKGGDRDVALAGFAAEIGRLADELTAIEGTAPAALPSPSADQLAEFARAMLAARRRIADHFPVGLFADPARDLLLDLYVAHHDRKNVTVTSACVAAAVPATTGLRWIHRLKAEGFITMESDSADLRRVLVRLSDQAHSAIGRYVGATYRRLRSALDG